MESDKRPSGKDGIVGIDVDGVNRSDNNGNGNGNESGNGNDRKRSAADSGGNGNGGNDRAAAIEPKEKFAKPNNVRTVKPRRRSAAVVSGKPKFKKGLRPLLSPEQTDQIIDSGFGGLAIVVGSQWAIEQDEAAELSKCLYSVLELFPVKIEDNPLILQRMFAIFGLVVALISVCTNQDRLSKTLKGKNDGIISRAKKKESSIND